MICTECGKRIQGAKSIAKRTCDDCKPLKKRLSEKKYRMNHKKPCQWCGQPVIVGKKHEGVIYCRVCGIDGKNRRTEYIPRKKINVTN